MAKCLSVDLRRRVVDAVEEGASCRTAAERFGVGVSSAIRNAIDAVTPADCRGFFNAAGYEPE